MALTRTKKIKNPDEAAPAPKPKKVAGGGKAKRFVLLIGDDGGILVYMEGNKVVRRLFAPSPQPGNIEAIVRLMQENPKVPLSILVDSHDQQFVRQTFPPVSSLSVKGLVKRRLDRDFQAEDLKGSLPLGRDKGGRKEWHFLLIALAKTTLLTEWIDLISELPNEFKGIYLVPVEAQNYLVMLNRALPIEGQNEWQLIVTHNKVSGFRQVVMHKNRLVFTRVTQVIDDAIAAVLAGNIEQEIINTVEYLRRLDFKDDSGLDITVIAAQEVNEALDLKRFEFGHNRALTPLDVADALGFEQAALSADRFGDVVMSAAFLRTKKHILRFSTAYADALAKFYSASKAIKLGGALVALAILGLTVSNVIDMQDNKSAAEESNRKRIANQTQLESLKKQVANLDKGLALKSIVVSAYDVYVKDSYSPLDFARVFSPLLTPEERVQSLDWKNVAKPTGAAAAAAAPAPDASKGPIQIKAELLFMGSYADLDALSRSEQSFLTMLSTKLPEYTVGHEAFPWATGSEKGLEISFDEKQAAGLKEGSTHLTVTFTGPKKVTPTPGAPTPGAGGTP